MTHPTPHPDASANPTSLGELASYYDGVLCDIWGVLHNGAAAFPDAVDALCKYRARGGFVVLITNAPRSCREIYPQLERFGVPRDAFDAIVTSGDVTSSLIAKHPKSPLFHFGPARDRSILDGVTNPIVAPTDAKLCLLTGPLDDTLEAVDTYQNLLTEMRDRSVRMICANPDLVVRSGDRLVICAGSIAQRYVQLGGSVIYAGKPEAAIYTAALNLIAGLAGRDIPKNRLLVIGDGLPTDIRGAAENGFDALFVIGGIHAHEFGVLDATELVEKIESEYPTLSLAGICDRLRWD